MYITFICLNALQDQHEVIAFEVCGKKYKTKGGLNRHHTGAKHSQNHGGEQQSTYSNRILADIVSGSLLKVINTKVYSASLKRELNLYTSEQVQEGTEEFGKLKTIYEGFAKNGNAEKFYGKYCATIPLDSTRFFKGLSQNAATFLSTKVADCMLAYCKKKNATSHNALYMLYENKYFSVQQGRVARSTTTLTQGYN